MKAGARVALVTAQVTSSLTRLAHLIVLVPGETTKVSLQQQSRLPLATALEQSMLVVLDALIAWLAERSAQTPEAMMGRHANVE